MHDSKPLAMMRGIGGWREQHVWTTWAILTWKAYTLLYLSIRESICVILDMVSVGAEYIQIFRKITPYLIITQRHTKVSKVADPERWRDTNRACRSATFCAFKFWEATVMDVWGFHPTQKLKLHRRFPGFNGLNHKKEENKSKSFIK